MMSTKILIRPRFYHGIAFLDFYEKTTGESIKISNLDLMKKKHPNIDTINHEHIKSSIQILKKFNISEIDACHNPHLLRMNPITLDNYGEILKECGFIKIVPDYIIRYHTNIRSKTIAQLKTNGLLSLSENLEEKLLKLFPKWPPSHSISPYCIESSTSLLDVRMKILQLYLNWRLKVTKEEFIKYSKLYLPIKHKPMADIQASIDLARNCIKLEEAVIRRNGFIIAADPVNIKLIIDNVPVLAGIDILEVLRLEPAILKTNHIALLEIVDIFKEYGISEELQRKCLKVFCLRPSTIRERLNELVDTNEYNIFASNPRVLSLVVHKNKMMKRLSKIQATSKTCYSLNTLVASSKVFDNYINNLGEKNFSHDMATLIFSSLDISINFNTSNKREIIFQIAKQLKRHKYALRASLNTIFENMKLVKKYFGDEVIIRNCQLVVYPYAELETYINVFFQLRNYGPNKAQKIDTTYINIDHRLLTEDHIMSLIQYEIEKKYHFTDDGIWGRGEQKLAAEEVNR